MSSLFLLRGDSLALITFPTYTRVKRAFIMSADSLRVSLSLFNGCQEQIPIFVILYYGQSHFSGFTLFIYPPWNMCVCQPGHTKNTRSTM